MAGQANHFRVYAPTMLADQRQVAYGANRYTNEVHRLHRVPNKRLAGREYLADAYSIADMVSWPWTLGGRASGVLVDEFPNLKAWNERMAARPAVKKDYRPGRGIPPWPCGPADASHQ